MKPMVTDTLPDLARLFCGLVGLLLTILPTDLEMLSVYLVVFFHFRDGPNKMWCPYFEEDSELLYCLQDIETIPRNDAFFVLRKTPVYPPALSEGSCHLPPVLQR